MNCQNLLDICYCAYLFVVKIQWQWPTNKSNVPSTVCTPKSSEINNRNNNWILVFLCPWAQDCSDYIQICGDISELPARCTHYVYTFIEILLLSSSLNDLIWLPVIHRLDSLLPPPLLSSNRRFMTQGDDMHRAMFGTFRAPIMNISSESNFSPQLLPHTYALCRYSMSKRQGGHIPYTHTCHACR